MPDCLQHKRFGAHACPEVDHGPSPSLTTEGGSKLWLTHDGRLGEAPFNPPYRCSGCDFLVNMSSEAPTWDSASARDAACPEHAACDPGEMTDRPGRFYEMPAAERDHWIVVLKRRGWSNARIGKSVGLTESGVRRAVQRIREGGFGQGATRS